MPVFQPSTGMPGVGTEKISKHRVVSADGYLQMLPGGVIGDGTKLRDPDNADYTADGVSAQRRLRAGLYLGKVASGGKYANSVIGVTNGALTNTGTTLTLASAQQGVELLRRVGATGTFKVTGPPTAAGVVRTITATYSAISSVSVTITALGVNEVQTLNFTNSPAGTFRIGVVDSSGVVQYTQRITYSATIGTLLSNINTALDAITAASAIVASGSVVTAVALTFSGTGYAALPQSMVVIDADALTAGDVDVTRTTTGVDGRFVTGSFVQPTDGSETILSFLPGGWEMIVPDDSTDLPIPHLPIEGTIDEANLLPWPADASLKQWVRDALKSVGRYTFTGKF